MFKRCMVGRHASNFENHWCKAGIENFLDGDPKHYFFKFFYNILRPKIINDSNKTYISLYKFVNLII
jgi:hypothetical protein